jgi:hypothetical protein
MTQPSTLRYFVVEGTPVVALDGHGSCVVPALEHGGFRRERIDFGSGRVVECDRNEFIQALERWRGGHCARFQGVGGAALVLYDVIEATESVARERQQPLAAEERALVWSLRKRTHAAFEADLRARGITGTPESDGGFAVPLPPAGAGTGPIPADGRALDAAALTDVLRRLQGLGAPLRAGDARAVAGAVGWPITERTGDRVRLDARLALGDERVWFTVDRGTANLYVPITDFLADSPESLAFTRDAAELALQTCARVLGRANGASGGRWPEWLWLSNGVGIFLRQGGGHVALMAMTAEAAAGRMRAVAEEAQWE